MKTRFKFTLPEVDIQSDNFSMKTQKEGHLEIELEYALDEIKGLYDLQKQALKEMPSLLKSFIEETSQACLAIKEQLYKSDDASQQASEEAYQNLMSAVKKTMSHVERDHE